MRYDFHHSGVLDYKDFLRRLGVQVPSQQQQQLEQQSTKGGELDAMNQLSTPWDKCLLVHMRRIILLFCLRKRVSKKQWDLAVSFFFMFI